MAVTSNRELRDLVEAEMTGRTIQRLNSKMGWTEKTPGIWHSTLQYRVKPTYRYWWVNEYPDRLDEVFDNPRDAEEDLLATGRTIKVREVIE